METKEYFEKVMQDFNQNRRGRNLRPWLILPSSNNRVGTKGCCLGICCGFFEGREQGNNAGKLKKGATTCNIVGTL